MTGINEYSTNPSNNTMYVPEGCAPSVVNDGIRQVQADVRTWYNDAEWINLGHTPTYVSASSFTVTGNQTAFYTVGRRIKITDSSTLYGTISSSAYTTLTTIGVTLDSGSISASISAVSVGIVKLPAGGSGSSLAGSAYVTLTGTETLTNKTLTSPTLTSPKINQILDSNGNEALILPVAASAVNEINIGNAATGNYPYISVTGGDTNIGIALQVKGTGTYNLLATSTAASTLKLFEQTGNGTNSVGLKAPNSVSSDVTFTLPSSDGSANQYIKTDGSGNLGFATLPPSPVKAWVNFTGSSGSINASSNVSSVTRNGTGDYTINFTNAMTDANYCVQANCINGTSNNQFIVNVKNGTTPTTSAVNVSCWNANANAAADGTRIYISIIGN